MVHKSITTDSLHHILQREYKVRIAICDDESSVRDSVKEAVCAYSDISRIKITVDEFASEEDILGSTNWYNIIILDYKMSDTDGIGTEELLNEMDDDCKIIFLTNHPEKITVKALEMGAFRMLMKPLDHDCLHKYLDDYIMSFGNDYPLLLKANRDTVCIHTSDIIYLAAENKTCHIYITGKEYHCAKTMLAVANLLPKSMFFRVSKGFIVNFDYINFFNAEYVYLKNGDRVPISRKYLALFKKSFKSHVKGMYV